MEGDYSSPLKNIFSPRHKQLTPRRRSLLTSAIKASVYGSGGRSIATPEVLYKTGSHTIENYGLSLPVLVTEALTFSDPNAQVSAKLSPEGWSWLVVGRKLLVWQHGEQRQMSHLPSISGTCRELTLPQTDLAHKADLVCIFFLEDKLIPSCFVASPEGVIRYWPSIAQEANYKDHTVALQGQECHSLINIMPTCCLLATTTFTFVAVGLGRNKQGVIEQNVVSKTLRPPSGWLTGISCKVSSLIFGGIPSNQLMETKLVNVSVVSEDLLGHHSGVANSPLVACITVGPCLEVWSLPSLDDSSLVAEKHLYIVDLRSPLREAFVQGQMFPAADVGSLDLFVLDSQVSKNGLLLLTAAVNLARAQLKYALTLISVMEKPVSRILSFVPLQPTALYRDESDIEALSWKLIWTSHFAYLYNRKQIMTVSSTMANDNPSIIELTATGDKLLGGSLCNDAPLFITKNHGVVCIKPIGGRSSPIGSPMMKDKLDSSLSLFEFEPSELSDKNDPLSRLKSAYIYYVRNNMTACWQILNELFPQNQNSKAVSNNANGVANFDVDAFLDRTVCAMYKEMLTDLPDPNNRLECKRKGNFVDAISIHVQIHLHEKLRAMVSFTEFLHSVELWGRLTLSSGEGEFGTTPTTVVCKGLVELVAAAIALSKLHEGAFTQLMNAMVQKAVKSLNEVDEKGDLLSLTDIFYSYPNYTEKALLSLGDYCVELAESDNSREYIASLFQKANHILITVLREVNGFRKDKNTLFSCSEKLKSMSSTISTWSSKQILLAMLTTQQALTVKQASSTAVNTKLVNQLYDQAIDLADLSLTEAKTLYSKNLDHSNAYKQMTKELVKTLVDCGKYQHATVIAEKYHCFEMLVVICDKTADKDKFYQYLDDYKNEGFANCAYTWYADAGRLSTLLSLFREHGGDGLSDWLQSEQGARAELQWCHNVQRGLFLPAADSLVRLVDQERQKDIIGRVQNMMSIAKLCAEAALETPAQTKVQVDHYLNLIEHHTSLPPKLVDYHGFGLQLENETMRMMTPEEIVLLYLHSELTLKAEDYAKALGAAELADEDAVRSELKMKERVDYFSGKTKIQEVKQRCGWWATSANIHRMKVNSEAVPGDGICEIMIWCHTILKDDWTIYDPEDLITSVSDKLFFKIADYVHSLDYDLAEFLPLDTELIERPELSSLQNKKEFMNLLRYGYQYLAQVASKRTTINNQ